MVEVVVLGSEAAGFFFANIPGLEPIVGVEAPADVGGVPKKEVVAAVDGRVVGAGPAALVVAGEPPKRLAAAAAVADVVGSLVVELTGGLNKLAGLGGPPNRGAGEAEGAVADVLAIKDKYISSNSNTPR